MAQDKNSPVQVFRAKGVKVSVFQNSSEANIWHKITIQKIYREEGGAWKTTASLGRDDLPVAQMLIGRAWQFVLDAETKQPDAAEEATP